MYIKKYKKSLHHINETAGIVNARPLVKYILKGIMDISMDYFNKIKDAIVDNNKESVEEYIALSSLSDEEARSIYKKTGKSKYILLQILNSEFTNICREKFHEPVEVLRMAKYGIKNLIGYNHYANGIKVYFYDMRGMGAASMIIDDNDWGVLKIDVPSFFSFGIDDVTGPYINVSEKWFTEALTHELTHFIENNNKNMGQNIIAFAEAEEDGDGEEEPYPFGAMNMVMYVFQKTEIDARLNEGVAEWEEREMHGWILKCIAEASNNGVFDDPTRVTDWFEKNRQELVSEIYGMIKRDVMYTYGQYDMEYLLNIVIRYWYTKYHRPPREIMEKDILEFNTVIDAEKLESLDFYTLDGKLIKNELALSLIFAYNIDKGNSLGSAKRFYRYNSEWDGMKFPSMETIFGPYKTYKKSDGTRHIVFDKWKLYKSESKYADILHNFVISLIKFMKRQKRYAEGKVIKASYQVYKNFFDKVMKLTTIQ